MTAAVRGLLAGYDRNSGLTGVSMVLGYAAIGWIWRRYLDFSLGIDWLLVGIWVFMTALLCWGIAPRRDLVRAAVGLAGGLYIESWGTVTNLWWYFTSERPPIWILPAWPVAAIAIDRLSRALDVVLPEEDLRFVWWGTLPPFVVTMVIFTLPYAHEPLTRLSWAAMLVVLVVPGRLRQDVTLMLAGAGLGIFLEYWGTSRHCWNYYTREIPPIAAVLAHGYAAVAFQRVAAVVERVLEPVLGPSVVPRFR
ncbi:MAG: hypothetical protein H6738_21165 [Alphaproteobacteria bacterium]|nr:hypothetical protein [Alphaproteobacteria bacterium]MCB9699305.1 hypothetical protein [Alphaproteobacteria bacterium]